MFPTRAAACSAALSVAAALAQAPPARSPKLSHRAVLAKGVRCRVCHAATAGSTTSRDPKFRFNHKLHLAVRPHLKANAACAACHRGLHLSDAVSKANFPQMADCLACHSQIEPPFSCEKCHTAPVVSLKPASHTPSYLDRHSSLKLDKPSCVICHGVNFRCLGCH